MRLIDADEFLKKITYADADSEEDKAWIGAIRRMIKEQPIAYDVDKVIAQLEESVYFTEPTYNEDGFCNDDCREIVYLEMAVEIVKAGGLNE